MASESKEPDEQHRWMGLALQQAYAALDYEEVPVGCVIVDERTQAVIAQAFNRTNIEKNVSLHTALLTSRAPIHPLLVQAANRAQLSRPRAVSQRGCGLPSVAACVLVRRRGTASSCASTTYCCTPTASTVRHTAAPARYDTIGMAAVVPSAHQLVVVLRCCQMCRSSVTAVCT